MKTKSQRKCGAKSAYRNKAQATHYALETAKHGVFVLPYRCPECHDWHLSSKMFKRHCR